MRKLSLMAKGKTVLTVVLVFTVSSLTLAALVASPGPVEERATAWADANGKRLPRSLSELAAFPDAYRRAIIEKLPTDERARLWLEHLRVLSEREDLSEQQRPTL